MSMWWRDGVLYQIYVRSFADSDGDGIGDLAGITARLDHLAWLGVDGVWLSPVTDSPDDDWGYDVADYCAIHPDLGTLADLDALVAAASARGIKVLLDLVPNHSSDRHPWFQESRSSRHAARRDWYVWADGADGGPPNNWISNFFGPSWTLDEATGQWYLHSFLDSQPDLNWASEGVRDAFDDILRFWFDRGIAGFRIDVVHKMAKDPALRDNPPATDDDPWLERLWGQRQLYNADRPEVHDIIRRWRTLAETYDPPRVLVGETYLLDVARLGAYYGRGDELNLAFNIPFLQAPFEAGALRAVVEATEAAIPPEGWPVWNCSSHDSSRMPTRWCEGDEAKVRCALAITIGLRGTPLLYYGDEIGMPDTTLQESDLRDPLGKRLWPAYPGRDPERTPMHWEPGPGAGFTAPGVAPWLPLGDNAACNVADQRRDPGSVLSFCRDLIAFRRATPDLARGSWAPVASPAGVLAWRRGDSVAIAVNLSAREAVVEEIEGVVRVAGDRGREGERVAGRLALRGWEPVVVVRDP